MKKPFDTKQYIIDRLNAEPWTTNRELYEAISKKRRITFASVAKTAQQLRAEGKVPPKSERPLSPEEELALDSEAIKTRVEKRGLNEKYQHALTTIEHMKMEREELFKIKRTPQTFSFKKTAHGQSEAIAILVASDWHVEEIVDPATVNGMNEYNPDIAKQRAEKFFTNGLRLIKIFQKDTVITRAIIPLLGDFFSNTIHEELQEGNAMMPGDAAWYAQSLIKSGIDYILKNSDIELTLVCHTGNHGRMTKKVHIATEAGNSLERYMYRNLAEQYDTPRVRFIIANGMQTYLEVFGLTLRFLHGHSIKYAGGVGGITIPIRKAIAQWNKVRKADITFLGHFHQCLDGGDFVVNGSLIGYNAFAQFIKADYEPPRQQFVLISDYNGGEKSVVAPIRVA
jgi:hypothetical protein